MAEETKLTFWQRLGSRKFLVYIITVVGIGATAWLVKSPETAGVIILGLVVAGFIYSESNVRAKIRIGGSEITTGGNGNGNGGEK